MRDAAPALVATVGGTPQPIVDAIRDHGPGFVILLCSKGSLVTAASIAKTLKAGMPRHEVMTVVDPDDLAECVTQAASAIVTAGAEATRVVADYTGGTKTMTAALVLAAVESGADASIVSAARTGLDGVRHGFSQPQDVASLRLRAEMAAAARVADDERAWPLAERLAGIACNRAPAAAREHTATRQLLTGLMRWDRFDHAGALDLLRGVGARAGPACVFLARLRRGADTHDGFTYELVYDLVANAARRASAGSHDDAVARLYRALELMAQVRLRIAHGIDTAHPPQWLADKLGSSQLALVNAYEALVLLEDPLGALWSMRKAHLLGALSTRNASILAHGITPIERQSYERARDEIVGFLTNVGDTLGVRGEPPDVQVAT